jgi:predicted enzyme related to lactoylglutathione lyase
MKTVVAFFEIPAIDLGRAVTFYETILGIKLSAMDCEHEKMAFFPEENGQCSGAISLAKDFRPSKDGVLINLHVDDMEKALSAVEANGGKIICQKTKIEAEGRGYFALFTDSEGNRLGLYSDK